MTSTRGAAWRGRVGAALGTVLLALLAAPAAEATTPQPVITSPTAGLASNNTSPVISGEVGPIGAFGWCETTVTLYAGESTAGPALQTLQQTAEGDCSWATEPVATLGPGTYTVLATSTGWWVDGETYPHDEGQSAPVTFTVDTSAPSPTITAPSSGATIVGSSLAVSGFSGTAGGDLPTVTVQVFAGPEAAGTPVQAIEVQSHDGAWSGGLAGLAPGSYTLQAQQTDTAGNVGTSTAVPITLVAPPPPPPPSASFAWFPEIPRVGETVTLVSSSTDPSSPITSFSWGLSATEPFHPGRSTTTTTFTKAGPHPVRLQVTDAAGRSSVATKTIVVRHAFATLMQPFPIVRIAGKLTHTGVKLTLLTVAAPVSSRVTVKIRGGGLRSTSQSRLAQVKGKSAAGGTPVLSFPRFQRALSAGTVLEISVTKAGQIGKYTRFVARKGKVPTRVDACLSSSGKPMSCPAT